MSRKLFSDCSSRLISPRKRREQRPLRRHTGSCVGQELELNEMYFAYVENYYAFNVVHTGVNTTLLLHEKHQNC